MAHQHRFVISEREGRGPGLAQLADYDKTYGTLLDGTLFSAEKGYVGPGANTGIAFWRAPFAQAYDGKIPDFTPEQLTKYTDGARTFWQHAVAKKWDSKRFFAYIIDEAGSDARSLANERKLQDALDAGAGPGHIRLIWTSHTDPATLAADPATDKTRQSSTGGAPTAAAAIPNSSARSLIRATSSGSTTTAAQPVACTASMPPASSCAPGATSAGATRSTALSGGPWTAATSRTPMTRPSYKRGDIRWGNGVLIYPGIRLPDVGLPAIDGPVSCLRMKAYRRGLQDYEYGWLLKQAGKEKVADDLVRAVIPQSSGRSRPQAHCPGSRGGRQS